MQSRTKVIIFTVLAVLVSLVCAGWRKILPQPFGMIQQVSQSQNYFWMLMYTGDFRFTWKTNINYLGRVLPRQTPAIAFSVGINDDLCAVDEMYILWCLKANTGNNWFQVPTPPEAEFYTGISILAYGNRAMIISDYFGNSFIYDTSSPTSWIRISDQNVVSINNVAMCGDGSIFGADFNGDFYQYNATANTWISRSRGTMFSMVDGGYDQTEVAAVSPQFPYRNYRMQGNGTNITWWRIGDYMTSISILGSRTFATDTDAIYVFDY